jgi:hypothetical protein
MKKIDNIFFLDEAVTKILEKFKRRKKIKSQVIRAGDSYIATVTENNEKSTIIFRPMNNNFTYEVNGHFYGTFFYENDKIVAKWPKHLRQREKRIVVNELQEFFRNYL